jgi:hypothetical protein
MNTLLLLAAAVAVRAADQPAPVKPLCEGKFSVEALVSRFPDNLPPELAEKHDPIQELAIQYYRCQAFVRVDDKVCAPLSAFGGRNKEGLDVADMCVAQSHDLIRTQAYISRSKSWRKICADDIAREGYKEFSKEDTARACAIMEEKRGDPAALCKELGPLNHMREYTDRCLATFRLLDGDESAAEQFGKKTRAYKKEVVLYARALKAKDAKLCGDGPVCRLLMGAGGKVCDDLKERLRALVCRAG